MPNFKPPKARNAAATLAIMGVLTVAMFVGITALAMAAHVHVVDNTARLVGAPAGYEQRTVIAQLAGAVFGHHSVMFFAVQGFTAAILVLAANTAFNGFPILASILGGDGYLPRQFHRRGDRLVFSNGVVVLAALAGLLIYAFDASTTRLIQLYIIGVFVSFTLSQWGMVRHWTTELRSPGAQVRRGTVHRARLINGFGAVFTALVLVVVLFTKFTHGAYIVVIAMPALFVLMRAIKRHYDQVARRAAPGSWRCHAPEPGARRRARVAAARPHPAGPGLRPRHPAEHPGRADRADLSGGDPSAAARVGRPGHPGRARGARLPLPRRHRAGPRTTSDASAGPARATSWRCSSRSTSSGTGGSTCCTTRAPCG